MPRIASITSQQLSIAGVAELDLTPVYTTLTPNSQSVNEGQTITMTLRSRYVEDGTTVGYAVTGISANDLDSGTLTGNFTVSDNSATVSWLLREDGLTEGTDTFAITINATDSAGNNTGGLSTTVSIADTSNDPDASLFLDDNDDVVTVASIISPIAMQINGAFAVSPVVPFDIEGRTSGAVTTVTNIAANTGTLLEIDDDGNSTSFIPGESLNLVIPTLTVSPAANNINEGSTLLVQAVAVNPVANGTQFYWTVSRPEDFAVASGSFTMNNNSAIFEVTPSTDATTEGAETFTVSVRNGSINGRIIATSNPITINDTSQDPTYTLTPAAFDIDEGSDLAVTVTTTSVPDSTILYWTIDNLPSNFVQGNGIVTISNNTALFNVTPIADYTTDGIQTFTISLRADSISGTVLDTTSTITVNDTTTEPSYTTFDSINESNDRSTTWIVQDLILGETYYFEIIGDTITTDGVSAQTDSNDFSGTNTVGYSGSAVAIDPGDGRPRILVSVSARTDARTEGTEDARINLRSMSPTGPIIASTIIRITDTSRDQFATLDPDNPTTVEQGTTLTIITNVSGWLSNQRVPFRVVNGTTSSNDFTGGSNYNVEAQVGSFEHAFGGDRPLFLAVAGTAGIGETFTIEILNDAGEVLDTTPTITIVDTTPPSGPS